ncbi:MAG: filamentous hemagglutinin N-terminal domain-containing protein [Cyanobacteria bacterium J06643_5]
MNRIISGLSYSVALCFLLNANLVTAQIQADKTLPINSNVIKNGINFKINGGTVKGSNLFHSFKQFNIPKDGEAFFNNTNFIVNILTRVTGNTISNIDGIIKANGSANLFLMNPNGIIFGQNARLDIGGSFIGTSANSIIFADKTYFDALNSQEKPLLTVSVPTGLQFGENSQSITVQPLSQLEVKSGNTLALVAGNIDIKEGILKSSQGNINLGSVDSGIVNISSHNTSSSFDFNYQNITSFKDINLQKALVDSSGFGNGSIKLQGRNIQIHNGSQLLIKNFGFQRAGDIKVKASESLQISGMSSDNMTNSSLINETFSKGVGGDIIVDTKRLEVKDGAVLESRTFSDAKGGNLNIKSEELVVLSGVSLLNPNFISGIIASSFGSGNAGNITISTANLLIEDGANLSSITLGTGNGGDVNVNTINLKLMGFNVEANRPSFLSASTINNGNAGNLTINTSSLKILDGANLNTSTAANGGSGNITINASDFIEIDGSLDLFGFPVLSNINSSATVLPKRIRLLLNLNLLPSGASGDVTIKTPRLSITNGAEVSVKNQGTGDAGRLEIYADSLKLNQQSSLAAATENGNGGNIFIETQDLQLRNNSNITATAMNSGAGGNIEINTDTLVALENSDITANAQNSFGGNVNINAQGVFGTREREEITNQSDITASSQLGASFSGTVELNTPGIDPSKGVNQLPVNVTDSSNQIASGCGANRGNTFVVTGRGGIPQNPSDRVNRNIIWSDIRNLSLHRQKPSNSNQTTRISKQRRIIEATGFQFDELGKVELVVLKNNSPNFQQLSNCGEL